MIPRPVKVLVMELEDDEEVALIVSARTTEQEVLDEVADIIARCEGPECVERAGVLCDAYNTWNFH